MKKLIFGLCILALAILVMPQASHAFIWQGITTGYSQPGWTATVNWEVWAPTETDLRVPKDGDYHYYYYVTNTSPSGGNGLKFFSVGNPVSAPVNLQGWVNGPGTILPSAWSSIGSSIDWDFKTASTLIYPQKTSEWLYFTTPVAPAWVPGGLQNGGDNDSHPVPGPAPEPASMMLFGLGLLGFGGRVLKRKRFKA